MTTGSLVFCIFGVILLSGSWLAIVAAKQKKSQSVRHHEIEQEIKEKKLRVKVERDDHEAKLSVNWPLRHIRVPDWRNWFYLMISRDNLRLGILTVRWRDELIEEWEAVIDIATIASVELQQEEKTVMKLETNATSRKTGSLGRAAIGGVLFGGAGAVVGAASAGSSTVATTTSTTQTLKGPVYLIIGTTDMERPVHRIQMNNRGDGEDWLYRIRGALELNSRKEVKI